jgi:cytochrome b subunit of formate dehydrogenase
VFVLLGTGWWLHSGAEGRPSLLARVLGLSDVSIHDRAGYVLAALGVLVVVAGARATWRFLADSITFNRGDARWLFAWPAATITGRFRSHRGHFDPGQRIANLVIVAGLVAVTGSGLGLLAVHGGSAFVLLQRIHVVSTYVLTIVLAGHVVIASGLLRGYRGVWRAMHRGGRVPIDLARRLWPKWAEGASSEAITETSERRAPPRTD